jgi:hypothetical protein
MHQKKLKKTTKKSTENIKIYVKKREKFSKAEIIP